MRARRIATIFKGTKGLLTLYIDLSGPKGWGKPLGETKAAVDDSCKGPIKGFGVLTDYAKRRWTQARGRGRDKILSSKPQLLTDPAGIYGCNEDAEMNTPAGFILDKGSYPWDVVS